MEQHKRLNTIATDTERFAPAPRLEVAQRFINLADYRGLASSLTVTSPF